MKSQKILYIFDRTDWKSRMPVAHAAKARGFDVILALIGPAGNPIEADGFKIVSLESAAASFRMIRDLKAVIRAEAPDIIHAVTLKYAFITGLAAMSYKNARKIYTLAGLGYLFRGGDAKSALLRSLTGPLLKHILTAPNTWLIFQNPDDRDLMIKRGFAASHHSMLVLGSGVDLQKFKLTPEPAGTTPIVLMPTRLVHDKGISVFIEAARILKKRGVNALFQIAGGETKHNPKAISRTEMEALTQDGAAQWLGRIEDMQALLSGAALIVYPSYYGEGIPRVLLEACAAGRAIITTDHPGCREAVTHNENGLLVPVKNARATADAIEKLLQDQNLRQNMGAKGRARAEKDFDVNLIAQKTVEIYRG